MALSHLELTQLHALLTRAADLDPSGADYLALERAVAHLAKTAKKKRQLARKQRARASDVAILQQAAIAQPTTSLQRQRDCYVCKCAYREVTLGYPLLCADCAAHSAALRDQPLDAAGRRALVTGGRVKIGYATALRLLRAGAEVHVTTRFPRDAEQRYAGELDAAAWRDRLHVHGLDFRDLSRLLGALEAWQAGPAFDIVINNAAQSVWHPPETFERLHAGESSLTPLVLPTRQGALDLVRTDSWVQKLGEIAPVDMVEVQIVNAIAPFLICSQLRSSLARSDFPDRYVVNVSAVEGQFSRPNKTARHPHTNMAKASLNMLTRTAAAELATEGIFMTSVDPGWMSQEGRAQDPRFIPPLAAEDCAARVLHPVAQGLAGTPVFGVLLKDFAVVAW